MAIIERGSTITLDLFTQDDDGDPLDATAETVSILDASGTTVVNLASLTHVGTGHYQYAYPVPAQAQTGAWIARWSATVDGNALQTDEGFTVVKQGALAAPASGSSVCTAWASHEDALGDCATYDVDPDLLDDAMLVASDVLWNLTGRKWFGVCSESIRPQAQWRAAQGPARWWPASGLSPYGWCSCHRGRETGCSVVREVKLPARGRVVADSIVVTIDGEPFTDFRLDDHRYLVRTDGGSWPCCQDLTVADDQVGAWTIQFDHASIPPIGGRRAAASLGCELAKLYVPGATSRCAVPKHATNISRQGVSITLLDPKTLFKDGITGIAEVDLWVASERQGAARQGMTVMRPGHWRSSRRTNR